MRPSATGTVSRILLSIVVLGWLHAAVGFRVPALRVAAPLVRSANTKGLVLRGLRTNKRPAERASVARLLAQDTLTETADDSAASTRDGVNEVLVYGAGRLGISFAEETKQRCPGSRVIGITKSDSKHHKLIRAGAEAHLSVPDDCAAGIDNVVFLLNPFVDDYTATLDSALKLWRGSPGKFVAASSVAVYQPRNDGGKIDESSPWSSSTANTVKQMLAAQKKVSEAGGTVLCFSGLYCLEPDRTAFLLNGTTVGRPPNSLVPVVSYPDAGRAILCALETDADIAGETFIVSDGNRQTVKDIFAASLTAGKYSPRSSMPDFAGDVEAQGAEYDSSKAQRVLGWTPSSSFAEYCLEMARRGEDEDA